MSKNRQFISVVAYVHNGADRIEKFIEFITKQCKIFKQCEVIFVDDYSLDNSVEIINQYFKNEPSDYIVSIVRLGRYHGMEVAMNAGRDIAIGDYVYEFDDLFIDFDGSVVMDAYNKCLEGNDIVTVSTDVPIRLTSKLYYSVINRATGSKAKIGQESFRLLSRRGINRIVSMGVDIPYRKVVYLNCGLSSASIKYKSQTGRRPARITEKNERLELALDSFVYFTNATQRLSLGVSVFFALVSIVMIIYTIVSYTIGYTNNPTWIAMTIFLSLGFMCLLGLTTLVIKYLSVLVDLVFKRQQYLITDIDKISSK